MKKVNFTLGLMLSMLFLGANFMNSQDVDLYISPSSSFIESGAVTIIDVNTSDNTDNPYTIPDSIRKNPAEAGLTTLSDSILNACANARKAFNHEFTIRLSFESGKEIIPFLKRKVWTGKEGQILIEELLLPYEITDKTEFSDGSGIATYKYTSEIVPLYVKYGIASIDYELWTNEHIGDEPGDGNAYPVVNRKIEFELEDGMSITPAQGFDYVEAFKDYTFEVYGLEDKELAVTTNNSYYAMDKGITVESIGDGAWSVTIKRVFINLELSIGYVNDTESEAGGENGETGNAIVEKDAVWAAGGTLYVKTGTPGILSIYNITGQLNKQASISGNYTLPMSKGIYIVQLNGKAYKVVL